jgi:tetratricopeptide (TPR) repeat protein
MDIAKIAMLQGNDNAALLNYHDVAQIFRDFNNDRKLGTCYNNIGCIHLRLKEYQKQMKYLDEAIQIKTNIIQEVRDYDYTMSFVSQFDPS